MKEYSNQEIAEIKKSPWNFFVKHSRVTFLVIVMILIAGTYAGIKLPRETQPEINLPFISVFTPYPNANPLDVEELVTDKIESAIQNLNDIDTLSSSSGFGMSTIFIQFETGTEIDKALNDVQNEVNRVRNDLPEDADDSFVSKFEANSFPVITFSLVADYDDEELKSVAEDVQTELEKVSGVSNVALIGTRNSEILVKIKPALLETYNLTISDVAASIRSTNINLPLGVITTDGFNYSVRAEAALKSAQELAQIPIKQFNNEEGIQKNIVLRDIATITEGLKEKNTISRFGIPKDNTVQNSVSMLVYKGEGGNIVKVAEESKAKIEEIKGQLVPDDVQVIATNDNSVFVQEDLEILSKNGVTTVILIMIFLLIFLGVKESLIAGLTIPISFMLTFAILYFQGETLNTLTLFSMVLALGLLIDNAIIIIEGIYENLKSGKYTSYGSAILAIREFKWPIISGTLTTVFVFLPMIFISGVMGQFMRVIPITVTTLLLASLFVNLAISPTFASKFLKPGEKRNIFKGIQKWYKKFITKVLESRFQKILYLFLMIVTFGISLMLPITGTLKSEAFPGSDFDYFLIDIELPNGTILEDTNTITTKVEQKLLEIPEILNFTTRIGTNAGGVYRSLLSTTNNSSNIASITVNLLPEEQRDKKSFEISKIARDKIDSIQGGTIQVTDLQGGPPSGAPIEVRIKGPNLDKLEEITRSIEEELKKVPGTLDVDTSIAQGSGEFNIKLDRNKLNYYGLSGIQVASTLRQGLVGTNASEIRKDGEDIDIILEYKFANEDEITLDDLRNISVLSPRRGMIPISSIIDIEFGQNLTSISHEDTERIMSVTSYIEDRSPAEITNDLQKSLDKIDIPSNYTVDYGGELEEIEQSFQDLGISMLIGVLFIFILLVLQFKSYSQPFIILLSLPFALTGVFFGLTALGLSLSIPSVIGIVGLSGVVVNDAIVLIDQMNKNRLQGMQLNEAISEGTTSRLQPVFLTTVTSIFGILPLALTNEIWGGLAFAFIFGLASQFFLVLLLDPILYQAFMRKEKDFGKEPEILVEMKTENVPSS